MEEGKEFYVEMLKNLIYRKGNINIHASHPSFINNLSFFLVIIKSLIKVLLISFCFEITGILSNFSAI